MGSHARIAPSSLAHIVACNASVLMQESAGPQSRSEEAEEGDAGHLVARAHAAGHVWPIGHKFDSGGKPWTVDVDMFTGAQMYARSVTAVTGGDLRLEDGVRCSEIHPEHCYGTPDAWRAVAKGDGPQGKPVIYVWDYKYGYRYVDAFQNWQMIAYALGVAERLNLLDSDAVLVLTIVQPRWYGAEGPVRTWRTSLIEIRALVNVAFNAAHAALGPNPTATTSAYCMDCDARHVCGTYRKTAAAIVDFSSTPELEPLDAIAAGNELRLLDAAMKRLEGRQVGLSVQVEQMLRGGQMVPGYALRPGQSRLKWDVDADTVEMLANMGGLSLIKPKEAITPTQAMAAGLDKNIVEQYASRPPAAMKVTAVDSTTALKLFGANRT